MYLSSKEFVHPGDWDVKLGKMKQSRYKTLQKSIFQDKFTMSPYENRDFEQFMMDPTKVCLLLCVVCGLVPCYLLRLAYNVFYILDIYVHSTQTPPHRLGLDMLGF